MQTGKRVPPEIVSLTGQCRNICGTQLGVVYDLFSILDDFCQLRTDDAVATEEENDTLVLQATMINQRLNEWYAQLPPEYDPSRIQLTGPSPEVLSDYVYVYNDLYVASILSLYRVCLLLSYEIVFIHLSSRLRGSENACSPLPHSPLHPSQVSSLQWTESAILSVIEAVCASAPYNLGFPSQRCDDTCNSTSPPAVQGNPVLWPLYICGKMHICPPKTRSWIIGRLYKLGNEFGIAQALLFARFLSEGIFTKTRYMDDLLSGKAEVHIEL